MGLIQKINIINIKRYAQDKSIRQGAILYVSMILSMLAGIFVSVINTRLLGPEHFGDLKFLQTVFNFAVIFFTFGLFVTGSRMLAQKKNEVIKSELFGALIVLAVFCSVLFTVAVYVFSFFENRIFNNDLGYLIRIFSPFLLVFVFQICLEDMMQGDNRIYELALFKISPQILYVILVLLLSSIASFTVTSALAFQIFSIAFISFCLIYIIRPRFTDLWKYIALIWKENKVYGSQVYYGVLASVAGQQLGGLSIGYFLDNTSVGFFLLAYTIALPLRLIPSASGTTFFKEFANCNVLPRKVTTITVAISLLLWLVFLLIIHKLILILYSKSFLPVVHLCYIISFGSVIHGLGDYINKFLGAHGKGKELRNSAIVIGLINLIGYTLLVVKWGIKGAAVTIVITGIVYFIFMYGYYKKYTQSQPMKQA